MKLLIDTDAKTLTIEDGGAERQIDLYSAEAFEAISLQWLRLSFARKYSYGFTWLGRPVIQLPEDLIRLQEAVFISKPDVIVEVGLAHGGSAVFLAHVLQALGNGRVMSVEVEVRPHNRAALEAHPLKPRITLIEGSSTDPATAERVRSLIGPDERVMVILDSNHSYEHVKREIELYKELVSPGAYFIVEDGIMPALHDVPGGKSEWLTDNPLRAIREFLAKDARFGHAPVRIFDETYDTGEITHFTSGWLLRKP